MPDQETAAPDTVPDAAVPEAAASDAAASDVAVPEAAAPEEAAPAGRGNRVKLHHLRPAPGARSRKIRVGRGESGRRGKTAGRGTKGRLARGSMRPGFEGGQTPLQSRIPHLRGFKPPHREEFTVVNVDELGVFDGGDSVTVDDLRGRGLARKRGKVKVLGRGGLDKALLVQAHAFSSAARAKIEAAGGQCEVVE